MQLIKFKSHKVLTLYDGGIHLIKKILIVDDNDDFRDMLSLVLEKENYSVSQAANGSHALDILNQERPDLIIMDLMMPDKSGWDVTKEIKKKKKFCNIPVIILSIVKKDDPQVAAKDYDAKAEVHIEKPFDRDVLLNTIKNLIGKSF